MGDIIKKKYKFLKRGYIENRNVSIYYKQDLLTAMGLFDIIVEQRGNKEIVKIIVASGSEKPYYLRKYGMSEKGCYIRVGSASEPMTAKQI